MTVFREMRRKEKQMTSIEVFKILDKTSYMVLSTVLEDEYPYSIPLNHLFSDGKIYFHSALEGQKCDAFNKGNKVCISIVESLTVVPDKFSTNFRSVTVFGKIYLVENQDEKKDALIGLVKKYSPGFTESGAAYIEKLFDKTAVYRIEIEHFTGKMSNK